MMSQIKDIFKKQRDLIDENEKLHEQLMKARSDMQQFKCSQQTAEKNHKRALEKLQRENNSLKARLDGELSSR
jgi:predicted  nucleic acid-binding Zn-ribbon protein